MRYDIMLYVIGGLCLAGGITAMVFAFQPDVALMKKMETTVPPMVSQMFKEWQQKHGKLYSGTWEESFRLGIFNQNYQWVLKHNSTEVQFGMTEFADMTEAEFSAKYLGYKGSDFQSCNNTTSFKNVRDVPSAVDWRQKNGTLTPVKNQGGCGSCWAFSTVEALESEAAIHGKGLQTFSEQQLVDCSTSYGNEGCNGGLMDEAFHYVIDKGITTESAYPYVGVDQKCATDGGAFKIKHCYDVPENDCDTLKAAIATQPIAVAVDAGLAWQMYFGGVLPSFECGKQLDHGVQAVGYNEKGHWFVRNSWGRAWGEKGFITLAKGNTCGICKAASWPSVN